MTPPIHQALRGAGASVSPSRASVIAAGTCLTSMLSSASSSLSARGRGTTRCENNNSNDDDDDHYNKIDWDAITNKVKEGNFSSAGKAFRSNIASVASENIQAGIDTGIPTQLSYGFLSGYCSGYALKKVGKSAALVLGLGFMSLQSLSYYGYIKVDHSAFQRDVQKALDLNRDGIIDQQDGQIAFDKITNMLKFGLPSTSGFAAGFVGGLRSG